MASKEIKFNLRLAIDGKEQMVSAVTTAKELKETLNGVQENVNGLSGAFTKNISKALSNINQIIGAVNGISTALQSLAADSSSFAKSMAIANTMAGKGEKDFAA